jgi:hypothetical protein
MGAIHTTNNHRKRYRTPTSVKTIDNTKHKSTDRFRTTMRSITLRALASRNYHHSVSSSNNSTMNNSSLTSPHTITTINSQMDSDTYLSDFDYRKLSTLTGLSESKINELHREFLILSYNGQLSYERYKSMLETISFQRTPAQLDKLARQTFTIFDKDGNNYLDFAEFIAAYVIMEKNELCLNDTPLTKESAISPPPPTPRIASVSRQATTYYTPQRTLVSASPMIQHRPVYMPTNYQAYHHCHPSEPYAYVPPQYSYR